ncbi:MAG: hypothetical protein VKL39_01540, partial [Leptolyngbyaceae bacterium]|nr:hypothetical protein [Leptolyngbyaceae bacterium]
LVTSSPADEAFFADCEGNPAQRLRLELTSPQRGAITPAWDGQLVFSTQQNQEGTGDAQSWDIDLQLVLDAQVFSYRLFDPNGSAITALPALPATELRGRLSADDQAQVQDRLASRAAGETVVVMARVKPSAATSGGAARSDDGFRQTLTFPLRVTDPDALPLPLRPAFLLFEDPEYNRQLVSSAATATVGVLENQVLFDVTLACDRQEYNPDSTVFFRYDWSGDRTGYPAELRISRVNAAGIVTPLNWPSTGNLTLRFENGKLQELSLATVQSQNDVTFSQGDTLQFEITAISDDDDQALDVPPINLAVTIVQVPVIPATQNAYGLLRTVANREETSEPSGEAGSAVHCVRFAWGPVPARIELVCAEDLRNQIVRRRAVFLWTDTARPLQEARGHYGYAIQKITQTGSTHFPTFET